MPKKHKRNDVKPGTPRPDLVKKINDEFAGYQRFCACGGKMRKVRGKKYIYKCQNKSCGKEINIHRGKRLSDNL